MEDIKHLIDKYFSGETSGVEEMRLREYFSAGNDIPEDLLKYKPLFIGMELKRQSHRRSKMVVLPPFKEKKIKKSILISVGSIAAALLLLLTLKLSFNDIQNNQYVIIDGKRYNDKELAQQ